MKTLQGGVDATFFQWSKRYAICELAVVYEKTALLYLHNDSYEKYIEFIQKSRERLAECSRDKNIEDGT